MLKIELKKIKAWIFIIAAFGLCVPGISGATLSQDNVEFGEVLVDTSKSITLELKNVNPIPMTISCSFKDGNLGFTTDMVSRLFLPEDSQNLTITFAPKNAGPCSDVLLINYSASLQVMELEPQQVQVSGIGILEEVKGALEDSHTIEGLLAFYNESVQSGALIGLGKGKSADNRLNTFGEMLNKAEKAIIAGDMDEALAHLRTAYKKINVFVVEGKNKSTASGAISELKKMIKFLLQDLGDK